MESFSFCLLVMNFLKFKISNVIDNLAKIEILFQSKYPSFNVLLFPDN